MKQPSKNEIDLLNLINRMQAQLIALEMKIDTLIFRSAPETKTAPKPHVTGDQSQAKSHDHHNNRMMYKVVCADCKKECTIPFKPNGDRPVYCKDCFSRRKVISMSGMKIDDKPKEGTSSQATITDAHKAEIKTKKKTVAAKKTAVKKKPATKKKK